MTVTDLRQQRADTEAATNTLAERMMLAVENSVALIALETARAMANETGLHRFQDMVLEAIEQHRQALAHVDDARQKRRVAVAARDAAKDAYENLRAEQQDPVVGLGGHFETRSNKSWLARHADGSAIPEDDQKPYLADEKKDWIARNAEKVPDVARAKREWESAVEAVAQVDDDIRSAEARAKACADAAKSAEHLLDAAREELVLYGTALRSPNRTTTNGARA